MFFALISYGCHQKSFLSSTWLFFKRHLINYCEDYFKCPHQNCFLNLFSYSWESCLKAETTLSLSEPSSSREILRKKKKFKIIFLINTPILPGLNLLSQDLLPCDFWNLSFNFLVVAAERNSKVKCP